MDDDFRGPLAYETSVSVLRGGMAQYTHGQPALHCEPPELTMHDGTQVPCAAIVDAEGMVIALVPDIQPFDVEHCEKYGLLNKLPEIIANILNLA